MKFSWRNICVIFLCVHSIYRSKNGCLVGAGGADVGQGLEAGAGAVGNTRLNRRVE